MVLEGIGVHLGVLHEKLTILIGAVFGTIEPGCMIVGASVLFILHCNCDSESSSAVKSIVVVLTLALEAIGFGIIGSSVSHW